MKIIGIVCMIIGIAGYSYDWISRHITRSKRLEEILTFLRKAGHAMEETHTPWIRFFEEYQSRDACVTESIHEVSHRLKENRYPRGELVWQDVMTERKETLDFSKEAFELLFHSGDAFFGKSQKENLELLNLYKKQLFECKEQERIEFAEKKRLWIPVGALGGVMIIIILI